MKKFFTRQIIIKSVEQCLKRFPVTVGFTVSLAVFLLVVCWGKDELFTERQTFTINYYLTVGSLISLSLRLWGEEVKRKRIVYIANALLHLLLLADAGYLYLLPEDFPFLETGLAHGSALTALGLSIFTLPFFREKDDIASWNFTLQLVSHAVTSWIIGGIMCGGLCLLTASFSGLFGLEVNGNFYTTWLIVFCLTLPSLLFLGQIPAGEAKHDRIGHTSAFLSKVIRYLFLPLLAITGRMGFLVSHRTDCGLHRSRILYVPFSPPRTFTFRATCGAWVAHRHPAPVSTDDYRHRQTIQRLRHHSQPPVPSDSEHLVLHSLYRLIRSTGTAHSMDCRVVCRHLSAHIRTSGKLCPTHPSLHVPSLIDPNPNII